METRIDGARGCNLLDPIGRGRARTLARVLLGSAALAGAGFASAQSQVTERVSVATGGGQGNGNSLVPSVSADGRFVAFSGGAWGGWHVYLRDRATGTTERVSVATDGTVANGYSGFASISSDGRYVAFESTADNLDPIDTNGWEDVYVRDRLSGTTALVSVAWNGSVGDQGSGLPRISADGRYVAFRSTSGNLVQGDVPGQQDVFVRDLLLGTTELVSVATDGTPGNDFSGMFGMEFGLAISANGRFVAFQSLASNLVAGDSNGTFDIFVRDLAARTTERVSLGRNGVQADWYSERPSISGDGRLVAFKSSATNLVQNDTNGRSDIFVRDRQTGTTQRVSVATSGAQANNHSEYPGLSADGRYVAFETAASNLVPGDTNGLLDVFVRDRLSNTTERASVSTSGAEGVGNVFGLPAAASVSPDGRYVAFASEATNLVAGDTNGVMDVFLRDRAATGFTSLCDPGVAGVTACPCSNPPSGPGRGCDNSSATGGASLQASGIAYLSMDSLVFTTSGEKPTALSIVGQWTGANGTGAVFGMGVRCTAGSLRRLYSKSASGGSITAPDFGAGEPSVSARSAAKGDVIQPGQSRWYLVYYRDPVVLGGCSPSSTFNSTQTGQVTWWM